MPYEQPSMTPHYVLRSVILGGMCWLIVRLVQSGNLTHYIAPRMEVYVKFAAIGLFVIAVFQAYGALQTLFDRGEDCGCEHPPSRSRIVNLLTYGMFLCPLLMGFLMPDTVMGSDIAAVKGMRLGSAGLAQQPAQSAASAETPAARAPASGGTLSEDELRSLFPSDAYSSEAAELGMLLYGKPLIKVKDEGFIEMLTTIDIYRANFIGKELELSGFVYREDGMEPGRFVVSRLTMQCCSADATPYGIMAEGSGTDSFKADTWVTLRGTIGTTTYNGNEILKLDVTKISKIPEPETPYVYPYFDLYRKLAE